MTNEMTTTKQTSISNDDISSVINEVIEYTKDQATISDVKSLLTQITEVYATHKTHKTAV